MTKLPPNVKEVSGRLYYRYRVGPLEKRERLPALDDEGFDAAYGRATRGRLIRRRDAATAGVPNWLLTLAREARKRAKRKALPFEITATQLAQLWQRSQGECELTGIPFDNATGAHRWRPYAVSFDRLDCSLGYVFENVRLVCVCVNAALNQWGDDVFWTMVTAASKRLRGDGFSEGGTFPKLQQNGGG